ncbi:MAG: Thymidylate synthase ThyX [Pelotomaculum sp. PtaB.Bin104]|nr:MAG: Thymidylate synthase ThyX [Pelotomaculum sp. PtaB.Bin104]
MLLEIRLISISPEYLKTIWFAARTCYSPLSPVELFEEDPSKDEMLRIADRIISMKHLSVLEHCHMTYAVKDVSRTLLAQYSRHRIGVSISVQSQRWVSEQSTKSEEGIFDFVIPPKIEKNKLAKDILLNSMKRAQEDYDHLLYLGIKKEDARFVLPGGAGTNFVTSLNLRSFFDVYTKRVLVPGAQWEIKQMLNAMADLLIEREPWLEKYLCER